jgi:Ca-activated chloride channel family protein
MNWFKGIEFAQPGFFWLLLVIPLMIAYYYGRNKQLHGLLGMSSVKSFALAPNNAMRILRHYGVVLRSLALIALVTALARPQSALSWNNETTEGIDIMIATDISGSMLSEDFKPNRLEAGKNIAIKFIKNRPRDLIGLVVFSGESFTQCPLTIDHDVLINLFHDIKNGMIDDGTAIGMGLATAVNRLKNSAAKSKVIILLTDGVNNMGSIPPVTAAEIAKQFGVRVYTVGLGTNGSAPYPFKDQLGRTHYQMIPVEIDEATLGKIASITGGKYFRARNNTDLTEIYRQIDKMEKVKIAVTRYHQKTEHYLPFAIIALAFLTLEILLNNTFFKGAIT